MSAQAPTLVAVRLEYCLVHFGTRRRSALLRVAHAQDRRDDDDECNNARWDMQQTPCNLRPLFYVLD